MADSVSRQLLLAEAKRRQWQVSFIGHNQYFCKITDTSGHSELFRGSRPLRNSANGFVITKYKNLTMEYVESLGYKVPAYLTLEPDEDTSAEAFLDQHQTIVVKPLDGQQSIGVTTTVNNRQQLWAAIELARQNQATGRVILQRQLSGKLYRLFVINGSLVAAAQRKAAEVVGDNQQTVQQLIERANLDPRRGTDHDTPLKKIKLSDAEQMLGSEGLQRVPKVGEVVRVSSLDSVSAGGEAANVTDTVHPDWRAFCDQVSRQAGLFVAGYDVICPDISQPIEDNYIPLLEINSAPGLKLHHYPTAGGEPINVARRLLDELFIAKNS